MTLREALQHPKVLLLTAAYFFIVTGNYGVEIVPADDPQGLVRARATTC